MVFRLPTISLAWLILLWTAAASAAPSATERETARGFMIAGDKLREAGDLSSALQRYQAAHALMHVPTTGLAVAETLAQLGQLIEAQGALQELHNMAPAPAEPAAFTKARDAAIVLAAALAQRICTLYARVQPIAAQYSLVLDDATLSQGALSAPIKLNPGVHTLRVRAPGYVEQATELKLQDGAVQQVDFELEVLPLSAAEPIAPSVVAHAAAPTPRDHERHSGRVRGLIGLGAGGLSLMVGVISGAVSWSQAADIRRHCGPDSACDAALRGELKVANTLGNIANVSVPLGVVGIAYGLYELLTLPEHTPVSQSAWQIDVAPNGVLVRGHL